MTEKTTIIDSHLHLDMLERHQPPSIQWLKEMACCAVSWSYFDGVHSSSQLKGLLDTHSQAIRRSRDDGMDCYYLAGIHPRSIAADLKPEDIETLLMPFLDDPLCRGVGEIGLETGNAKEEEIFIAQLEAGRIFSRRGKIIGIHTPRSDKAVITEKTLQILSRFTDISSSIVVDHCTLETLPSVLDAGFWAGVSLSPIKTSWDEMKRIASIFSDSIDRIMCNTDSAISFYDDVVRYSRSDDLSAPARKRLFYLNAARFYNLMEQD